MAEDLNKFKREMVTLHFPFRNENEELLAETKFIGIYDNNEEIILHRQQEFQASLDIEKTIDLCKNLCREDEFLEDEAHDVGNMFPEPNPFDLLYNDQNSDINSDIRFAVLDKLGAIAKKRENLMKNDDFYELMREANEKQRGLLMEVISNLLSSTRLPFQIFSTGPAGCGKTFVIKLLLEIFNRYTANDGHCNAYITCASTGKAAVAINGTTVHTAFKMSITKLLPLSMEVTYQYRALIKYVEVIIIDEISMISSALLIKINERLQQITANFTDAFGGLDVIFIGDLRQLPPVRATSIFLQLIRNIFGPVLWRGLKFYELNQVMRQANVQFASILTKVGNGDRLDDHELTLIQSRFFYKAAVDVLRSSAIRIYNTNQSVNEYNHQILNTANEKIVSTAKDVYIGCSSPNQEALLLPDETIFVPNINYLITTNINVSDGLANGAVGKLVHLEQKEAGEFIVAWLDCPHSRNIGNKIKRKVTGHMAANNIRRTTVPISRKSSTINLNQSKTISVKRFHLPLVCACTTTIHKSQGGTYAEVVYEYDKRHAQPLVYVVLSRVTDLEGLFIISKNDDLTFYHGRKSSDSTRRLRDEFRRLASNSLETIDQRINNFINQKRNGFSIYSLNCQSLRAHVADIVDTVLHNSTILIFSQTWQHQDENINLPNFNCIIKYKRPNVRSAGVAIYHNNNDKNNIVTPSICMVTRQSELSSSLSTPVGDFCVAEGLREVGKIIIIGAVYISLNQRMDDIVHFLKSSLMPYTSLGAQYLGRREDKLPMILSGDFNVNFASKDSEPLTKFSNEDLNLFINNDPKIPTTKSGTTIDAVFTRFLDSLASQTYISYFSYHKPIISIIPMISNQPVENQEIEL